MEDFWRLIIQEECSAGRQASIKSNNFELKPALITMVQQHQFTGHSLTFEMRGEIIVFKQG